MQFMACLSLISGDWKVHLDRLRSNHPKTPLFYHCASSMSFSCWVLPPYDHSLAGPRFAKHQAIHLFPASGIPVKKLAGRKECVRLECQRTFEENEVWTPDHKYSKQNPESEDYSVRTAGQSCHHMTAQMSLTGLGFRVVTAGLLPGNPQPQVFLANNSEIKAVSENSLVARDCHVNCLCSIVFWGEWSNSG